MLHLFAYGTLCRGEANDLQAVAAQQCLPLPQFIENGTVRGRLYDLGDWPGLSVDPAGDNVVGEVWAIDRVLVPVLDAIEEIGEGVVAPGRFFVSSVDVRIGDAFLSCWVYPVAPVDGAVKITDGDWRSWRQNRR